MNYLENLNDEVKEYFKVLSPEFPSWLIDYINTREMQRIGGISLSCGTCYSNMFKDGYFYSNLDHSVGVALILWNFTHDKKITLSGLFHDIATPCFKHCIDFMNKDYKKQESTEDRTFNILSNSKEINKLLKRDNIKLSEVCDYKLYSLADNNTPLLASDRLEFNFSSGLSFYRVWNLESIKKIYSSLVILKNENNEEEFGFTNKSICEEYINTVIPLWKSWISNEDRTVMNFIADICKSMIIKDYLSIEDLYNLSEKQLINKIENCDDNYISTSFKYVMNLEKVFTSDKYLKNKYCIKIDPKRRYINPLVNDKRIMDISNDIKNKINDFLYEEKDYFTYFDYDFVPYDE